MSRLQQVLKLTRFPTRKLFKFYLVPCPLFSLINMGAPVMFVIKRSCLFQLLRKRLSVEVHLHDQMNCHNCKRKEQKIFCLKRKALR